MSDRALRITMLVVSVIGLGVASYLTIAHYTHSQVQCLDTGCETVQHSRWSMLLGVPVALLGVVGYLIMIGSLLVRQSEMSRLVSVGNAIVGFGFSCYLTYRELFSIHAICPWCVSSAVMMTILLCLSSWRFLRGEVPAGSGPPMPEARPPGKAERRALA